MEEEVKISFWKKLKISIFGLEDYKKLIVQKTRKTILYLVILMLIFSFFLSFAFTYKISQKINVVKQYIEKNIETLEYSNGKLNIIQKEITEQKTDELFDTKIIIDTSNNLQNEKINEYQQEIKKYYNGIVILQDKIMVKTELSNAISTIALNEITDSINLVKVEKQDILNILSGNTIYKLYIIMYIIIFIYLFVIYLSSTLVDAVLYSFIGYLAGIFSNLRIRFKSVYNIAIHSLTLPIILNLIYIIINVLTGYTIKYFDILYMAITSIYIIAAILIIKSDIIKQQLELSKIMQEQEKVRKEMEEKEKQKKEQEEKERIRKKDEKQREKNKQQDENNTSNDDGNTPEPQANIKSEEI